MGESVVSAAAGIIGTLVGGLVTWIVTRWQVNRQLSRETYEHIDDFYRELIQLYLNYPQFGDPAKTAGYRSAFSGDELARYEFFAMTVHTFLETIFDYFIDHETGKIDPQWERIFDYHAKLHLNWLLAPDRPNEPEYVEFVRKRCSKAGPS